MRKDVIQITDINEKYDIVGTGFGVENPYEEITIKTYYIYVKRVNSDKIETIKLKTVILDKRHKIKRIWSKIKSLMEC